LAPEEVAEQNWGAVKKSKGAQKTLISTMRQIQHTQDKKRGIYLEVPVAFPKLIVRRRREGTPINIASIFYKIHFSKSNFTPEFLLHIPSWETTSAGVFLRKHFIGHFLIVPESVPSADSSRSC
jgi:hypothetical protein